MNQHSIESSKSSNEIAQFEIDDLFDEMDFKPVTEGLGFHHEETKKSFTKSAIVPRNVSGVSIASSNQVSNLGISNPDIQKHISNNANSREELNAFYSATKSNEIDNVQKVDIVKEVVELVVASKLLQFVAWSIDLLLISSTVLFTTVMLAFVSGIEIQVLIKLVSMKEMLFFTGSLFIIFYLLYFTILDLATSPGKSLLGIYLIKEDNTNVRVINTFLRSLVTLLSMITLGLPSLIDFQGKLSDSKVVVS